MLLFAVLSMFTVFTMFAMLAFTAWRTERFTPFLRNILAVFFKTRDELRNRVGRSIKAKLERILL